MSVKIEADAEIPFPRDVTFRVYRDELPRLVEFLPNVRRIEEKSRRREGALSYVENVWHGGGEIPAAARVMLNESMLSWTDHATWDDDAWACRWRIETHSFREAVSCSGENRFFEGAGGTRFEIRGTLDIDAGRVRGVPKLLAGSVNRSIADLLVKKITPNLIEVSRGLTRFLERRART